jgi:hypothetical protein
VARGNASEVETVDTEVEEVTPTAETTGEEKPAKEKAPKRGDLPEGFVTPVGFAKILTEKKLHRDKDGNVVEVKPQMVYSYLKNSPKDDKLETTTVKDSNGIERKVLKTEDALAWWERKNERVAGKKANAAAKAEAKAKRASEKTEAGESEGESTAEVTEAE